MTEITLDSARLRAWRPSDEESLARHADNWNVARNLSDSFPHPYSRDDARNYISRLQHSDSPRIFAIEVAGEAAGGVGLHPESRDDIYRDSAEVGYWLAEIHWAKGIMTEAVRAITGYGFSTLGLRRIYATVYAPNVASARVLEKAGYRFEGRRRGAVTKCGEVMDDLLYAILRQDVTGD